MTGKKAGGARVFLLLVALLFAMQTCAIGALADDAEMLKTLPGQWHEAYDLNEGEEGAAPQPVDMTLTLEENGNMTFVIILGEEKTTYTYAGTWAFELMKDACDHLTLTFTSTDNPKYADTDYRVECVYEAYTESWEENDTLITYLLLNPPVSCSGVSPLEETTGDDIGALHREQGPNMRVVKCKDYVSLREKRSKSARRTMKVPLGAKVLAFPELGNVNGFLFCLYQGEYGYILAEYLQPLE